MRKITNSTRLLDCPIINGCSFGIQDEMNLCLIQGIAMALLFLLSDRFLRRETAERQTDILRSGLCVDMATLGLAMFYQTPKGASVRTGFLVHRKRQIHQPYNHQPAGISPQEGKPLQQRFCTPNERSFTREQI